MTAPFDGLTPAQREELADRWEKLVDAGLSEEEATMHLQRATQQLTAAPEKAVGGGLGFLTGLAAGVAKPTGQPGGYAGDVGQGPRFDAAQAEAQNQLATYEQAKTDQPGATGLGEVIPDALALLAGGAKSASRPGRFLGRVGKEYAKQTKIGRAIARAGTPDPVVGTGDVLRPAMTSAEKAAAKVADQIAKGQRGPKGGGLVSAKDAAGKYRGPKPKPPKGSGLDSPAARALAKQLNELLKQNMAKGK